MKTYVVSYSLTGNNDVLAKNLAKALGAEHIRITEEKKRTMRVTAFDMLLNRTPGVSYDPQEMWPDGPVVFVAPIWMGCIASPLRDCFKRLRKTIGTYAFVSISGGADDDPNPKLAVELRKRLRKEPAAVIDMHIADLLPAEPKPTRDDTSAYRVTPEVAQKLTETVMAALRERMPVGDEA